MKAEQDRIESAQEANGRQQRSRAAPGDAPKSAFVFAVVVSVMATGIIAAGYVYFPNFEKQYRTAVESHLLTVVDLIGALLLGAGACGGLVWWQQRARADRARAPVDSSTRRMAAVVKDSNDAITIQDFDGRITAWNRGAELMYGYGELEALSMNIERLTATDKVIEQQDFVRRLLAGEAVSSFETQRVTKDGRVLDVWMTVTKLLDDAGKPIGIASTERDITARKQEAEKLRQSEAKYRTLVENIPQKIVMKDRQFRWVSINQNLARDLGIRPEEVVGKVDADLFPPDLAAKSHADDVRIMETGKAEELEERYIQDEKETWVNTIKTPIRDVNGEVVGVLGVFWDITARKQEEKALRRFATVVRDSNDAITIQEFDGRITAWNRGAELMYGYSETEALTENIESLTTPDKAAEQKGFIHRLIAGEAIRSFETQRVTKDGRILDVWMTVTKLMDDDGTPAGLSSTERDITARKREEKNLRRFATVVKDSNDAITIQDFQGGITAWNRGAELMYGYSEAEALTESIDRLTTPDKVAEQKDFIRRLMAGEAVSSFETQRVTKDGRVLDVWMTVTQLMDDAGKPIGIASTERDITARKQTETALQQSALTLQEKNAELERFLYTTSHDLKSPVVTVRTFLDYLAQDMAKADAGRIEKDMRFIRAAADKMARLLDELLQISRIGRVVSPPVDIPFRALADETLSTVAGRLAESHATVIVGEQDVTLHGDPLRLAEIWQNLVENACKFIGDQKEPRIEMGVETRGADSVFFVRDNGIGIDPCYHAKVFRLFEKLDSKAEGTGLGLAIVKRIVELYRGRIWVESHGQGQGACFYFTLPEAVRCQVSGVRCQVSGVRCRV